MNVLDATRLSKAMDASEKIQQRMDKHLVRCSVCRNGAYCYEYLRLQVYKARALTAEREGADRAV